MKNKIEGLRNYRTWTKFSVTVELETLSEVIKLIENIGDQKFVNKLKRVEKRELDYMELRAKRILDKVLPYSNN